MDAEQLASFVQQTFHRVGIERLPAHLEKRYGVKVSAVTALDVGVFRIDRHDGPSWVARVFSGVRPIDEVEGDAAILRVLEQADFPSERCAHAEPVSVHEGQPVLITDFIESSAPSKPGSRFAILGGLLGGLNARPAATARAGGAWHHLSSCGSPRDEIDAARTLVAAVQAQAKPADQAQFDTVLEELDSTDDAADLPQGFVHPDAVPSNAITIADGLLVIVDWTGAGRGPRLWSLAWLLWVAGSRDPRLVDAVMSRYSRHVSLEKAERERLARVMCARPLTLDCWALGVGRKTVTEVVQPLAARARLAETIAKRATT